MNILITGGSGFLGKHVLQKLIGRGHSVSALARSNSSAETVRSFGAIPIVGDISKVENFSQSLKGMDAVVHCAAPVEFWGPWEKYQQGIVDSTIALAAACEKQGVKRFIHISSESVLQGTHDLLEIDESLPYPLEPNSYYGKAKKIVEEHLIKMSAKMRIIILRPTFIWGPDCPSFSSLSEKVKSGKFVWIDQGKAAFEAVHVENVAEAVRLSITGGEDRGIYLVTDDEKSTVRDFFEQLFGSLNLPIPMRSIPGALVRPLSCAVESVWKTFRIQSVPPITRFDLAFVAMPRRYNINRIKTDLRYRPVINRTKGFAQLKNQNTGIEKI